MSPHSEAGLPEPKPSAFASDYASGLCRYCLQPRVPQPGLGCGATRGRPPVVSVVSGRVRWSCLLCSPLTTRPAPALVLMQQGLPFSLLPFLKGLWAQWGAVGGVSGCLLLWPSPSGGTSEGGGSLGRGAEQSGLHKGLARMPASQCLWPCCSQSRCCQEGAEGEDPSHGLGRGLVQRKLPVVAF